MDDKVRWICDDTSDMTMWELAHNQVFVRDREAWYRDFDRELPARDLIREILKAHRGAERAWMEDDDTFDDVMLDWLADGTDTVEGVCAIFYSLLWGAAETREWLKLYETYGLPTTTHPEVLERALNTYGSRAQEGIAIEEMSELIKAIIKLRRAKTTEAYRARVRDISEEMADVIIMLMQLLLHYRNRAEVQTILDDKIRRLARRLENE